MKISVIIATFNRSDGISRCVDSIEKSLIFASVDKEDAEIIVVDNNSTDNTVFIVKEWAKTCFYSVQLKVEKKKGVAAARNCGMTCARGDIFIITDDDICLDKEHIKTVLFYDYQDSIPVLRSGMVELGDSEDLPMTILTHPHRRTWHKENPIWSHLGAGVVPGGNMVIRRDIFEKVGLYDETLGPGTTIPSGEDSDYIYRAYLAGFQVEYAPDIIVYHFHGRRDISDVEKLQKSYALGAGALYGKYLFNHPNVYRKLSFKTQKRIEGPSQSKDDRLQNIKLSFFKKMYYYAQGAFMYYKVKIKKLLS